MSTKMIDPETGESYPEGSFEQLHYPSSGSRPYGIYIVIGNGL